MHLKKLKECKVLVTPTSFGRNDPRIKQSLEEQVGDVVYNTTGKPLKTAALLDLIAEMDGYIAGLDEINRDVIAAAKNLKVIARYGVGVDNVDLEAAMDKGIVVTNTPGANSGSVAELTVGLLLALARNIVSAASVTQTGEWPRMTGHTLEGKTVGLIGFGNIGKQVARRLSGFDCCVMAYDIAPDEMFAKEYGVILGSIDEVVRNVDFLSLHCSTMDETRGMVNQAFIAKMKTGAYLINTARGELIDESALLAGLESGKIAGAALDVLIEQPPTSNHPLLNHPKVILTPHMGAHTDGAIANMGWGALQDCLAVLRGETPNHRVL